MTLPHDTISLLPPSSLKNQSSYTSGRFSSRRNLKQSPSKSLWLLTFTDTIALMLTFFVMTFSMANPKQEVWEDVKEHVNMEFSTSLGNTAQRGEINDINLEHIQFKHALNLSYLEALLTNQLAKRNLTEKVFILPQDEDDTKNRLILTVPHQFLFTAGQAELSKESLSLTKDLSSLLKGIRNSIEIVGHADPTPPSSSSSWNSNWNLSLQRAMNVSYAIQQSGYDRPMHVRGLSSALYNTLPDSLSPKERLTLSRRVDIIIYDKQENFKERLLEDIE